MQEITDIKEELFMKGSLGGCNRRDSTFHPNELQSQPA